MVAEKIVEKYTLEIKRLKRFRAHIPVLKLCVGLPDETINKMLHNTDNRIAECEICIRELNVNKIIGAESLIMKRA